MRRLGPSMARDGLRLLQRFGALPARLPRPDRWLRYARETLAFARASGQPLTLLDLFPVLGEAQQEAGAARGHYFHQDLWAARLVRASGVERHIDVGSRIDGFVAHCSLFTRVEYVDIRAMTSQHPNITFVEGSILALPFGDRSVASLSSLHVVEHIGLGRYGDPIDPDGTDKAVAELARVLAPGGQLYLGVPVGRERVCFNAHRVLAPSHLPELLPDLTLRTFCAVDDAGDLVEDATPSDFARADYACGLYHFERPQ